MTTPPSDAPAAINDLFAATYARIAEATVAAVDPLLIVHSTPSGGHYALLLDGERESCEPVPDAFRFLKSIAHAPTLLAVLRSSIGRALDDRDRLVEQLDTWSRASLGALDQRTDLCPAGRNAAHDALVDTIEHLAADPSSGPIGASLTAACEALIVEAGRIQAQACRRQLEHWRDAMGPAAWSRLYAIVGTGWGMREHGTHYEILRHVLGRDAIGVRLFSAMGTKDEEALRHRLGVILANRSTSAAALGDASRMDVELIGDAVVRALRADTSAGR